MRRPRRTPAWRGRHRWPKSARRGGCAPGSGHRPGWAAPRWRRARAHGIRRHGRGRSGGPAPRPSRTPAPASRRWRSRRRAGAPPRPVRRPRRRGRASPTRASQAARSARAESAAPARSGAGRLPAPKRPSSTAKRAEASATSRLSGPTVSMLVLRPSTPSSGSSPKLVLRPTRPFQAAGTRTEPPVSEPIAAAARPRERETAAPEDDPPGSRATSSSKGLGGVPVCGFRPRMEKANSLWLVLPRQTRPARVARARTLASPAATRSASTGVPWPVTSPALS